jgi:iron-sulfur cluster assembly protein
VSSPKKAPTAGKNKAITRDMIIADIVGKYPFTIEIFMDFGIHCFSCSVSEYETIEQGVLGHGFTEEELQELLQEINSTIENPPPPDEYENIPV